MDGILKCDDKMFDVNSIAVLDCFIWVKSRVEVMTLHRSLNFKNGDDAPR